ncbi:MAG: hypothetical protein P8L85_14440, partial [Rubripirellula sp.]|nr:hypothetical protein [Rubripirellula sp.]
LQKSYPLATLQSVLWEQFALPATASFQDTIDVLLGREAVDIAVFILWSRLGSPFGSAITKTDGGSYLSGTERHCFSQRAGASAADPRSDGGTVDRSQHHGGGSRKFPAALKALAESGHVAVLAMLRSDFYHYARHHRVFSA